MIALATAATAALNIAGAPAARAADLYWDINGSAAGASTIHIATGTWDLSQANWTTDPTGSSATTAWVDGSTAVFAAGTNVTTGTISIADGVNLQLDGLRFEEGTSQITLTRAGTGTAPVINIGSASVDVAAGVLVNVTLALTTPGGLTKTGDGTLIFGAAQAYSGTTTVSAGTLQAQTPVMPAQIVNNATVAFSINTSATYAGQISGTGAVTMTGITGLGSLLATTFTSANTYTGATTVTHAGLTLSGINGSTASTAITLTRGNLSLVNTGSNNSDRIGNASTVFLHGGSMTLAGLSSGHTDEVMGALDVGVGGANLLTITSGSGGAILEASSFVREPGATLLVRGTLLGQNNAAGVSGSNLRFTSAPALAGSGPAGTTAVGALPGVIAESSATANGSTATLATYDVNGVRQLTAAEYAVSFTADANVAPTANATVASSMPINALEFGGAGNVAAVGGVTTTIAAGQTLTLNSGMIFSNATSASTITGGTLAFGAGGGGEAIVFSYGAGSITINSAIQAQSLTKSGTGTLTLGAASNPTLTGTTTVNQGTLVVTANNHLGSGVLIGNSGFSGITGTANAGGSLRLSGNVSYDLPITLSGAYTTSTIPPTAQAAFESLSGNNTWSGDVMLTGFDVNTGNVLYPSIGAAGAGSSLTLSGVIQNGTTRHSGLHTLGLGDIVLTGASPNTFTSLVRPIGGRIIVEKNGAFGPSTAANDLLGVLMTTAGTVSASTIAFRAPASSPAGFHYSNFEWLGLGGTGVANDGVMLQNLGGANTFSGGVSFGSNVVLPGLTNPTKVDIVTGSSLELAGPLAGRTAAARDIVKTGGGDLIISGDNSAAPAIFSALGAGSRLVIDNGAVVLRSASPTGGSLPSGITGIVLNAGGSLVLDNTLASNASRLPGVNTLTAGGGELKLLGADRTFTATVVGSGNITFSGDSTLTLAGTLANTNAGMTTVNSGTLRLAKPAGVNGVGGGVTVNSSATLLWADNEQLANNATLVLNAGGTIDLAGFTETLAGLVDNGGTTILGGGALNVTGNLDLADGATVNSATTIGGHVSYTGTTVTATIAAPLTLSGPGAHDVTVANGTADPDLLISGGLSSSGPITKLGAGTLELSGGGSVGDVNINAGLLKVSAGTLATAQLALNDGNMAITGGIVAATGHVFVADGTTNAVTMDHSAGTLVTSSGPVMIIGRGASSGGTYNLSGSGLLNLGAGSLSVGGFGHATLNQSGGSLIAGAVSVAANSNTSTYTMTGGTASVSDVYVGGNPGGAGGVGVLNVGASAALTSTGVLKIWNTTGSVVNLSGGSITAAALDTAGNPSRFNWTGGTFNLTGSNLDVTTAGPLGANLTLGSGMSLGVPNNSLIVGDTVGSGGASLSVNAGAVAVVNQLVVGNAAATTGTVTVDGASLTVTTAAEIGLDGTGVVNVTGAGGAFHVGGTLQLWGGGALNLSTGAAASAGALSGAGAITNAGATLTVGGSGVSTTYAGVMSGANGALTKTGAGTLRLAGADPNTYSGLTTVAGGFLELNKPSGVNAIAGNVVVNNSGILRWIADNQAADNAAITLNSGGTLDLNGHAETIGALVYNGGTTLLGSGGALSVAGDLTLGDGAVLGTATTVAGNILYAGTTTAATISGPLTLGGAGAHDFDIADGAAASDLTVSGVISGATAGVTKSGSGSLTFSAANAYTGATSVSGGVLTVGNAAGASSSLGANGVGEVFVAPGATLNLGGVAAGSALNFGQKIFHIAGDGAGGFGAITNRNFLADPTGNTGGNSQQNVLQRVILDGDASIGSPGPHPDIGTASILGRFDIRATPVGGNNVAQLDLNGHDLTKIGNSFFALVNTDVTGAGDIIVDAGTLNIEGASRVLDDGTSRIIVRDGALQQFWSNGAAGATNVTRPIEMGDGMPASNTFMALGGANSSIGSPILLKGDLTVRSTANNFANLNLTLLGNITEDATPRKLIKDNVATLTLSGSNSFTGGLDLVTGASHSGLAGGTGTVRVGGSTALHSSNVVSFNPAAGFTGILQLGGFTTNVAGLSTDAAAAGTAIVENAAAGSATLIVNSTASHAYAGVIRDGAGGGALALAKHGSGTLTLAGSASYTGATNVNGGTLQLGAAAGANNVVSGIVNVNAGGTIRWLAGEQMPNTAILTLNAGGTLDLNGFTETVGSFTDNGGTTVLGGGQLLINSGNLILGDGTVIAVDTGVAGDVIYTGSTTAASVTGNLALGDANSPRTFNISDGADDPDVTVDGVISGAVSLVKAGAGTLALNGANTFGGSGHSVTIAAGSVRVAADAALGDAANTLTLSDATLNTIATLATARPITIAGSSGQILVNAGTTLSVSGSVAGGGELLKTGGGTLATSGASSVSRLVVDGGAYTQSGAGASLSAPIQFIGNTGAATFEHAGGTNTAATVVAIGRLAGGNGTYTLASGSLTSPVTYIGFDGQGTFVQTGGTHTNTSSLEVTNLGFSPGASGSYLLSGGAYNGVTLIVGRGGTGLFTQTGGTVTTSAQLQLGSLGGSGTYNLDAGTISTGAQLTVGWGSGQTAGTGTFNQAAGTSLTIGGNFNIGGNAVDSLSTTAVGVYNMNGGQLTQSLASAIWAIGNGLDAQGTFNQSGGTASIAGATSLLELGRNLGNGHYNLSSAGVLDAATVRVGARGTGTFTQTGGAASVAQGLFLGFTAAGNGSYALSGGALQSGFIIVGDQGVGTFTQTGGTYTTPENINIASLGGSTGAYTISGGGSASSLNVFVGGHNVNPGGVVAASGTTKIWDTAGTTVNLAGGTLSTGALDTSGNPSRFNWTSGTLNVTGAGGLTINTGDPLGSSLTLGSNKTLNVINTLTVGVAGNLTIGSGGVASAGSLSGSAGGIVANDGSLTIGADNTTATFGGVISGAGGMAKVGTGTFRLTAVNPFSGVLTVNAGVLEMPAGSSVSPASVVVSGGTGATFAQTGGTNTVTGALYLGDAGASGGTYSLSGAGGSLSVGGSEYVGHNGAGVFSHTDGTHNVTSSLLLGTFGGSSGSYNLSGTGSLSVGNYLSVGEHGAGTFAQSGGSNSVAGHVYFGYFGGASGTYDLSGGTLGAQSIYVGGGEPAPGGAGVVTQGGGTLSSSDTLKIWDTAGTAFNLAGGTASVGSLDTSGNPSRFNWTAGTLNVTGAGGLTLSSTGPLGASVVLGDGKTLAVAANANIAAGGALTISGTGVFSAGSLAGAGSLATNKVIALGSDNTSTAFSGAISGAGGLSKSGSGAFTLTRTNNSFTGNVTISGGGTLVIAAAGSLGPSGSGSSGAEGTLTIDGATIRNTSTSLGGSFTFADRPIVIGPGGATFDVAAGNGILVIGESIPTSETTFVSGAGNTLTKVGPGELRYQGADLGLTAYARLVVNQGLFRLGTSGTAPLNPDERAFGAVPAAFTADQITLDGGAIGTSLATTLHPNRGITLGAAGGMIVTSAVFDSATFTIPGAISGPGGLTVRGTGVTVLAGANTYAGDTQIGTPTGVATQVGGTLRLGADNALPATTSLKFDTMAAGVDNTIFSTFDLGDGVGSFDQTVAGIAVIAGPPAQARVMNSGSAVKTFTVNNAAPNIWPGNITGNLNLRHTGSAELILSSSGNTYTGATINESGVLRAVAAGALPAGGDVVNNGTFEVLAAASVADVGGAAGSTIVGVDGTPATLTADHFRQAALEIRAGSTAVVRAGGVADGISDVSLLALAGVNDNWTGKLDLNDNGMIVRHGVGLAAATLGMLHNRVKSGLNVSSGTLWSGTGGITSTAAATDPTGFMAIGIYSNQDDRFDTFGGITIGTDSVVLAYTKFGDANLDGGLDVDDLTALELSLAAAPGADTGWQNGDFNYDGAIDRDNDYSLWIDSFFAHGGALTPAISAAMDRIESMPVPEPGGAVVIGAAAAVTATLARRRRRRATGRGDGNAQSAAGMLQ